MDEREKMIRLWFSMWLEKKDLGIDDIFAENVIYTESWGPPMEKIPKTAKINANVRYSAFV